MTEDERGAFEELLRRGSRVCFKFGRSMPLDQIMKITRPYVRAANAAEKILDPLRTHAERIAVEREAFEP